MDPHDKGKTASQVSYLYQGNPYTCKDSLCIETGPRMSQEDWISHQITRVSFQFCSLAINRWVNNVTPQVSWKCTNSSRVAQQKTDFIYNKSLQYSVLLLYIYTDDRWCLKQDKNYIHLGKFTTCQLTRFTSQRKKYYWQADLPGLDLEEIVTLKNPLRIFTVVDTLQSVFRRSRPRLFADGSDTASTSKTHKIISHFS